MNPFQSLREYELSVYALPIKHHRIPAPGLSLDSPNLVFLIREIEAFLPPSLI